MSELIVVGSHELVDVGASFEKAARELNERVKGIENILDKFHEIEPEVIRGVQYTEGSLLYTIYAIALQKDAWDAMSLDQRAQIGEAELSFYQYIALKYGVSQSKSTIENYTRVANVWLNEDSRVEIPGEVQCWETDEDYDPVMVVGDGGEAQELETDPWNVGFSKLLAATSKASKGQMEEQDWGMLFNPDVSQGRMLGSWHKSKKGKKKKPKNTLVFVRDGSLLCVSDGDETVPFAELDEYEIENNPLAQQGWMRLQRGLRVQDEEDF